MNRTYQICTNCILDTNDDPYIFFDENGVCNHCHIYEQVVRKNVFSGVPGEKKLKELVEQIKSDGKNKEYECIIGISGGADSTYLAYMVKQLGLRPLVVQLDNGWNSEVAVKNIENIINKLEYNLYTYVINWEEFKDLQLSFLKASVVDIEMLTDHAIIAIFYKLAKEKHIKYILTGYNVVTEGVVPSNWVHNKNDLLNIKSIHKKYGKHSISSFPTLGFFKLLYYEKVLKIKIFNILNYISYNKQDAKNIIIKELGWEEYGAKHHESIFTRFYQTYILPQKFNIDKRKSHFSTLICSGQISRETALKEIKKPIYNRQKLLEDKEYVIKKLGLTEEEFECIMKAPQKKHIDYRSIENIFNKFRPFLRFLKYIFLKK